jgi:hypothetical protein
MKRRRMLELGIVGGVAAAATGCAAVAPATRTADWQDPELGGFLADLDASMARIGAADVGNLFALGKSADPPGIGEERLVKKALRSLVMTGAYRELSDKAKRHDGVKARVEAVQPELDDAVLGVAALLGDLNEGDRVELQMRLKDDPKLPNRVAEWLDGAMSRMNMPTARRLRLRRLAQHVGWRLEHQPVSVLLEEYVAKVDKVSRRIGYSEELKRQVATRALSSSLLAWQDPATALNQAGANQAEPPENAAPTVDCTTGSPRGTTAVTVGGVLLGVSGALAIGGGVALATSGLGGAVFVLTAAGVLLLAGLITLIVGLVLRSGAPAPCKEVTAG